MGSDSQLSLGFDAHEAPSAPVALPGGHLGLPDGRSLPLDIRRSRRRTISLQIQAGSLRVSAPTWVSKAEIDRVIESKVRWIARCLDAEEERAANRLEPHEEWCDGAEVRFLGEPCRIRLDPSAGDTAWNASEGTLCLPLSAQATPDQIRDRVHGWLQGQAEDILRERLELLASAVGLRFQRFSLSSARTRWGSCTSDGHIRLNWRLVQFPLSVIDYVAAHELAHIRAMDHSPGFWDEVEKILPNYREAKAAIRRARI